MRAAYRLRLELGESQRGIRSGLAAKRTLVGKRRGRLEGNAQALQELLPVAGSGGENEPPRVSHHIVLTREFAG